MTTKTSPLLSFAKLETGMPMPHLLDIQTRAFQSLLQPDGMEEVGEVTKTKRPKNIIEKEVYLGELPILTPLGTFVINGAERVIVSQLHRSPGVVFEESIHPNGQRLFSARIIPFRGSWVEFTVDIHDVIDVHIATTQQAPSKYVLAFDVADPDGEVVGEAGRELSDTLRKKLLKSGVTKVDVLLPAGRSESPLIKNTLAKDPTHTEAEALAQIYTLLRPGEAPNLETAREALKRLFFHPKRYDLGKVGRYKINQRLKVGVSKDNTVLTEDDFVAIIRYLIELSEGRGYTDDIDHLGNRRVRSVGELIANQITERQARVVLVTTLHVRNK